MQSPTPAEKPAFIKQKLPTELIGIICEFSDLKPHTAIRSTCSSVRLYVPLRKVVGFEEYKELITLYKIGPCDFERHRVFQERIHLDLHHEALTQNQVVYLGDGFLCYELCRIARKVLDYPEAYKKINLIFGNCFFLIAAVSVDDLKLFIRLLEVPLMNPSGSYNRAISEAARLGREIFFLLLQDPRVDPSDNNNSAIRLASQNGHLAVEQELLQDPRVDPSDHGNLAIRWASEEGHLAVVEELLKDPRVDPSEHGNLAVRFASQNVHLSVVQALLKDPRVDPSGYDNQAIRLASENGHVAIVQALLQDPRVKLDGLCRDR